jgi:hypothetical protein
MNALIECEREICLRRSRLPACLPGRMVIKELQPWILIGGGQLPFRDDRLFPYPAWRLEDQTDEVFVSDIMQVSYSYLLAAYSSTHQLNYILSKKEAIWDLW